MTKSQMKFLLRSGSLKLTKDRKGNGSIETYKFNGKDIYYRSGSSDVHLLYEILLKKGHKGEYWIPNNIDSEVIFDIGGNIGMVSIYYATRFPDAKIYAFEPIKENFELLNKNVKAFNVALGFEDGEIEMMLSDSDLNFGGGSIYNIGVNTSKRQKVQLCHPSTILKNENISQIDLIKIDTEGAEYDILNSFVANILNSVKWVIGELHGINDFKLLDMLSNHFDIGLNKKVHKRLYIFNASNKNFTSKINKEELKYIND